MDIRLCKHEDLDHKKGDSADSLIAKRQIDENPHAKNLHMHDTSSANDCHKRNVRGKVAHVHASVGKQLSHTLHLLDTTDLRCSAKQKPLPHMNQLIVAFLRPTAPHETKLVQSDIVTHRAHCDSSTNIFSFSLRHSSESAENISQMSDTLCQLLLDSTRKKVVLPLLTRTHIHPRMS